MTFQTTQGAAERLVLEKRHGSSDRMKSSPPSQDAHIPKSFWILPPSCSTLPAHRRRAPSCGSAYTRERVSNGTEVDVRTSSFASGARSSASVSATSRLVF